MGVRGWAFGVGLIFAGCAMGQQPDSTSPAENTTEAKPGTAEWSRLSVNEKLQYDWRHVFDPENLIYAGVGAGFDQWINRPPEWGQGWGSYGERYASHIGSYLTSRTIRFTVQAIDHEEPRYHRSQSPAVKRRIADALLYTVWRPSDEGDHMPAYSEIFGAYGAAALSRTWLPPQYRTASSVMLSGSNTLLIDSGINVFHEFTPEIKQLLHIGKR